MYSNSSLISPWITSKLGNLRETGSYQISDSTKWYLTKNCFKTFITSALYPTKSQKLENSNILNELFAHFLALRLDYLMMEIKFSFIASFFWLKLVFILTLLILGGKEIRASRIRQGKAKVWGRSGVHVLTVSRFELQERCFFRSIFTALLDALHFTPEVLHGGAVHGGLRIGATERGRRCGLVGKHPVNSSAARKRFSEKRDWWKINILLFFFLACRQDMQLGLQIWLYQESREQDVGGNMYSSGGLHDICCSSQLWLEICFASNNLSL